MFAFGVWKLMYLQQEQKYVYSLEFVFQMQSIAVIEQPTTSAFLLPFHQSFAYPHSLYTKCHISISTAPFEEEKNHLCRGWMVLGYWRWAEMSAHLSSASPNTSWRLTLAPQFCCVGSLGEHATESFHGELATESLPWRACY